MRVAPWLLVFAAPLAACTVAVQPTEDTPGPSTYVEGSISIDDPANGDDAGGPTFVFRYDCADPPPPVGTARPVDFLIVQEDAYVAGEAPFTFPQVPPDNCLILTGFVDRDRDFDPFLSVTNQMTAGDLAIGQVVAQVAPLPAGTDQVPPVLGLELEANLVVPLERPAFTITDDVSGDLGGTVHIGPVAGTTGNTTLRLQTKTVDTPLTDVENPVFTVVFAEDTDENGWPDDNNGNGLPDIVWPKVLFLRLADSDPTGLSITDPPLILPGVVMPLDPNDSVNLETNYVLQSRLAGLPFDGQAILPATDLTVVIPPLVLTDLATQSTDNIEDVLAGGSNVLGEYQILVMNSSGQSWSLPNELATSDETQASRLLVTEPSEPLPPRTTVSGAVTLSSGDAPEGPVLVTVFDCASPPPPAGTGSPIDLGSIQPSAFVDGVASFVFDAIPAESCLIFTGYVDTDRSFAALYSISQLPTKGDLQLDTAVVQVGPANENGLVEPVTDVQVAEGAVVSLDPPAFRLAGSEPVVMTRSVSIGATSTAIMTLDATPHSSPMLDVDESFFTLEFAPDNDGNGLPDDVNGDAIPDVVWPRVLLLKLDPDDPEGLATVSPPIVLPGVVLPLDTENPAVLDTNLALQSAIEGEGFASPGLVSRLTIAVPGLVVTDLEAGSTTPIESVALSGVDVDGDYAVVVMNSSGQTWQVPNESILFATAEEEPAFRVNPPAPGATGLGAIEGSITTADASSPGGRTILFRFDCADPPPPAGTGRPLAFKILPEDDWVQNTVSFRFAGLEPDSCQLLTGFIDRDGDWDGLYGTSNQATAGDLAMDSLVVQVPEVDAPTGLVPEVVNQSLIASLLVPLERPVFTMLDLASGGTESPTMTVSNTPGDTTSVSIRLTTQDIDQPICEANSPIFTVVFAPDLNEDGVPEDFNGDSLPDVLWPKVFVRRLDPEDPSGIVDATDPPVVLPGIIVPLDPSDPFNTATNLVSQQTLAGLPFDGETIFPQSNLTIAVPGLVVVDPETATTAPIETVAASMDVAGEYQVLVMNSSGQTWSIPNEAAIFGEAGQGSVFIVEELD